MVNTEVGKGLMNHGGMVHRRVRGVNDQILMRSRDLITGDWANVIIPTHMEHVLP